MPSYHSDKIALFLFHQYLFSKIQVFIILLLLQLLLFLLLL